MAVIRLVNKEDKIVKEEEMSHDVNVLQPLPRVLRIEGIIYRFLQKEGSVNVYRESPF